MCEHCGYKPGESKIIAQPIFWVDNEVFSVHVEKENLMAQEDFDAIPDEKKEKIAVGMVEYVMSFISTRVAPWMTVDELLERAIEQAIQRKHMEISQFIGQPGGLEKILNELGFDRVTVIDANSINLDQSPN